MLAFSTQVRGFKPGRSRRIFKGEKILSMPSFGGGVKPSVPCCRFAARKRSLNGVEVVISAKITRQHSRSQFHLPPLGSLASWRTWRHLVVKVGTSKRGGKAMANYPKELAQDAAYWSHTNRLTELWSLPKPARGLNTYNNNNSIGCDSFGELSLCSYHCADFLFTD